MVGVLKLILRLHLKVKNNAAYYFAFALVARIEPSVPRPLRISNKFSNELSNPFFTEK